MLALFAYTAVSPWLALPTLAACLRDVTDGVDVCAAQNVLLSRDEIVAATKNDVLLRFINVFYLMSRKRR